MNAQKGTKLKVGSRIVSKLRQSAKCVSINGSQAMFKYERPVKNRSPGFEFPINEATFQDPGFHY